MIVQWKYGHYMPYLKKTSYKAYHNIEICSSAIDGIIYISHDHT